MDSDGIGAGGPAEDGPTIAHRHAGSRRCAGVAMSAKLSGRSAILALTTSALYSMRLPQLLLMAAVPAAGVPNSELGGGAAPGICDIYARGRTPCVAAHSMVRALYTAYDGTLFSLSYMDEKSRRHFMDVVRDVTFSFLCNYLRNTGL
eukprot:SAG31_NODE_1109_length_9860_cov_22.119353_3_plen_148_part_00